MPIAAQRAVLSVAGAALLASSPAPVLAQVDPRIVLNILVECSKIGDVTARVACYDTNIAAAGGTVATAPPPQSGIVQPGSAPVATAGVAGVARESARPPQPPTAPAVEPTRSTPIVAAVAERGPGAYLLTLQGGAQWEFAEDVPPSYQPPRPGSTVQIDRGSLGSYRMRFDGQEPVRVRRVR
jgi:hypothetical protein